MSRPATAQAPRAAREQRRHDVARLLARGLLDACVTTLAAGLGCSRQLVQHWIDPERDASISVADAAALPAPIRAPLAEYVAGPGYMMAELPAADTDGRASLALHVRALRETSEAVTAHAAALADGRIDRSEGRDLERKCDEALRELLSVREAARRAQREGVIGVDLRVVEGGGAR